MGVLHMPTAAGHHPLKSCPRHEAPPQIILKSVTFTMTTESPPRAPPRGSTRRRSPASAQRSAAARGTRPRALMRCLSDGVPSGVVQDTGVFGCGAP